MHTSAHAHNTVTLTYVRIYYVCHKNMPHICSVIIRSRLHRLLHWLVDDAAQGD